MTTTDSILGWAISHSLTSVPGAGNDVTLYALLGGVGLVLGSVCGLSTHTQPTRRPDGRRPTKGMAADELDEALPDELTPREGEVLALIAAGRSNAEIAAELVVSAATVMTHVNRIFFKTGARDRAQVVRYAFEHGLTR